MANVGSRHDNLHLLGDVDVGTVLDAGEGGVLARKDGAGMDGMALGENVG